MSISFYWSVFCSVNRVSVLASQYFSDSKSLTFCVSSSICSLSILISSSCFSANYFVYFIWFLFISSSSCSDAINYSSLCFSISSFSTNSVYLSIISLLSIYNWNACSRLLTSSLTFKSEMRAHRFKLSSSSIATCLRYISIVSSALCSCPCISLIAVSS